MAAKSIFRKKSLERLSTPDRLDELLRVVKRRNWLPLVAASVALALAVAWSFVGRIPITATGTALLAHPRQVVAFQSPASGQLVSLDVRVGDFVKKGQLLGTLNLPEIERQLTEERGKLAQFRTRDATLTSFEKEQAEKEKRFLARQRELIEKRVAKLGEMAESVLAKNRAYIEQQRANLATTRRLCDELDLALQQRFASYKALRSEGLSSEDAVVNSRRAFIENKLRLAELGVSLQGVELREIESEETYLEQLDRIADLGIQLQTLEIKEAEIDRRLLSGSLSSASEVEGIQRLITRLEGQLETRGRIVSEYSGRILEVTAAVGTYVVAGQRLGAMEAEDPASRLLAVAYFLVADGKRIEPGMKARISPSTVPRERFGSIRGAVTAVSAYPVTTDAAANQVGNREMAQVLTGGGNRIEVFADLAPDATTFSGLEWTSSGGPELDVTAGTTATIRVTTEERAPITFVLPFLRSCISGE